MNNATIAEMTTYPKPAIKPIATVENRINNSSAFALTLLNLINPNATAIVAILTTLELAPVKKIDIIAIIADIATGIKTEATKNPLVALSLKDTKNVNNSEITKVAAKIINVATDQ